MITTVTLIVLFVAVQIVTGLAALLFSNLDMLGSGVPISELHVPAVNTGISLLIGQMLLSFGLWWWFYRVEKPIRQRSVDNPELAGIFKFRPIKQEVRPQNISRWQIIAAVCGALFLSLGISELLEYFNLIDKSDMKFFEEISRNPWCILLMCVVGPLAEELTFRVGILRSLYGMKMSGWLASGITALLFAIIHGNLTQGIPAFIMGFLLGMMFLRSGDLRICLPTHIFNNTLAVICIYYAFDTPTAIWQPFLYLLVSEPLLIIGLKKTPKTTTA